MSMIKSKKPIFFIETLFLLIYTIFSIEIEYIGGRNMDINKFVGSKIKYYRKKKGMNQTELGKELGVKQNTVVGYEKGDWEVSYDNLFKLADIFEITIDDLFPATKTEYKPLENASKVTETNDLDYEDMILIKKITDKALTLDENERKKLMDNIKFAIDFFDKKD